MVIIHTCLQSGRTCTIGWLVLAFPFSFSISFFSPWELLLFDLRCFLCGDDNNSCILEHVPGFSASFGQLLLDNVTYIFNLQNKL